MPQITVDKETMADLSRLRDIGELAEALGVSRGYITAMKREGFTMPGGRNTKLAALQFLETAGNFTIDPRHRTP